MATIREKAEGAWENLKERDLGMETQDLMRCMVALIAMAGFLLPWITLDGHGSSLTGSEAIAYAITSPERATLFGTSMIGAVALLLVPTVTGACVLYGLVQLIRGRHSLASHLMGTLLPIMMILATGTIASSDGFRIAGMAMPGIGMAITTLAQGILFLDALVEGKE